MSHEWKDYTVSYRYEDLSWSVVIRARSMHDAMGRLEAMAQTGNVDGEIKATIPVPGFLGRFLMWLMRKKGSGQ